jgi:flagellar hook-length control protein FliK
MDRTAFDRSGAERGTGTGDASTAPATTPLDAALRTEPSSGRRTAAPGRARSATDGPAEASARTEASALATTAFAAGDPATRGVAERDRAAETSVAHARQPEAQAGSFATAPPAPLAAADVPAVSIAPAVTDPAFALALGEQLGVLIAGEISRADLVVSPPDLGPIRIELTLRGDNADLVFTAAAPETLQAIEASAEVLESLLAERGISLGGMDVGQGRPQQFAGTQGDPSSHRQQAVDRAPSAAPGPATAAATVRSPAVPAHRRGSIDLFA